MKTDLLVFVCSEAMLILVIFYIFYFEIKNRLKRNVSIKAEVTRSESSMNALYVNFGITTLVFTTLTQTCESIKGNQSIFIVLNFVILTYLFFFSSRFRNQVFFKLLNRITKD